MGLWMSAIGIDSALDASRLGTRLDPQGQSPVAAHASGGKTLGRYVGLGLAVARSLAHARGGELTAANAADGGAEFCLSLPLAESLGEHPTPKAEA